MKLIISGREYDRVLINGANVLHLMELATQTKRMADTFEEPLTLGALQRMGRRLDEARKKVKAAEDVGEQDEADRIREDMAGDALLMNSVVVFLTRRSAGEKGTFAQLADVDVADIEFVEEPGDDDPADAGGEGEGEADPTAAGPGSPGTPAGDAPAAA